MTIEVTKDNKEILIEALRLYIVARMDHISELEHDRDVLNEDHVDKAINLNKAAQEIAEDIWSNLRES